MEEGETEIEKYYQNQLDTCYKLLYQGKKDVLDLIKTCETEAKVASLKKWETQFKIAEIVANSRLEHNHILAIEKAMELVKTEKNPIFLAQIYNIIGLSYKALRNHTQSRVFFQLGIDILEAMDDLDSKSLNNLGNVYYNFQLLLTTIDEGYADDIYLQKAKEIYSKTNNKKHLAEVYNSLAKLAQRKQDYKTGIDCLNNGILLLEELGENHAVQRFYSNIAVMYAYDLQSEKAFHFIEKFEENMPSDFSSISLAGFLLSKADVHIRLKNYEQALLALNESEKLYNAQSIESELVTVFSFYSDIYAAQKDFEKAYFYLEQKNTLAEKLAQKAKLMLSMDANYEYELVARKNEAEFFKQKNKEIKNYSLKLNQSNKNLAFFSNVVSHDLKEPLRLISLYVDLLDRKVKEKLNDEENHLLHQLKFSAKKLTSLVNDLLVYNTLEQVQEYETCSFYEMVETSLSQLQLFIKENNANIRFKTPDCNLFFSKIKLSQLLQNVIANGIKYNNSTQKTIHLSVFDEQGFWKILIEDNGIGIKKENREKAFKIFNRLDAAESIEGTGLGLAICKKIVDDVNGKIYFEDTENAGSCLVVEIPK